MPVDYSGGKEFSKERIHTGRPPHLTPTASSHLTAPKPTEFGLSEQRLRYFRRTKFGFVDSPLITVSFFAGGVLLCVAMQPGSKNGFAIFLIGGLLGLGVWLCVDVVISTLQRRIHLYLVLRQPDYKIFLNFEKVSEAYELEVREREHQRLLRERAREEQLRERESWWRRLDGHRFEVELAELLKKRGYPVVRTGRPGDQGCDLLLRNGAETIIVQCKAHSNYISPGAVRDLFGTMIHHNVDEGWLVATNGFSPGAKDFARGKRIKLLTIRELLAQS